MGSPSDLCEVETPWLKPLTLAEIVSIAGELQTLAGARLQDCMQTANEVGLKFHHKRETFWLWFDLEPRRPMVVRLKSPPPARKKAERPLTLFIRSRFEGRRLKDVRADSKRGRILILSFHRSQDEKEQGPCEIEARLFPHGQNVIASDGEKSVSEKKPKELPPPPVTLEESRDRREWVRIEELWRELQRTPLRRSGGTGPQSSQAALEAARLEREWRRALDKKTKALERMRDELKQKTSNVLREVGEWLKIHRSLEVPPEWRAYVDAQKSLSWNIGEVFRRGKENSRKAEGTRERIASVERELNELQAKGPGAFARKADHEARGEKASLLVRAQAKGRRLKVADGLDAYIGKSAADNLALLRRAQPFDYWLHLRDLPGSHAILRRTRGRPVTDAEFVLAGRWVVEQSLGKTERDLKGERHDLLIVECRYVRPIKGDKLGRVNYTNDRVLTLRF